MYRIHFMSGKWLGIKTRETTMSDIVDNNQDDLENIIDSVDSGTPTILVESLDDLPDGFEYEIFQ